RQDASKAARSPQRDAPLRSTRRAVRPERRANRARTAQAARSGWGADDRTKASLGRDDPDRMGAPPPDADVREPGGHPPPQQRRHPWFPLVGQGVATAARRESS